MLEIRSACKTFNPHTPNEVHALRDLDLVVEEGEFVTVIGTNGSGKSTLLNAVAGMFLLDSGSVSIDGRNVTRWPEHRRASLIGRVFQGQRKRDFDQHQVMLSLSRYGALLLLKIL